MLRSTSKPKGGRMKRVFVPIAIVGLVLLFVSIDSYATSYEEPQITPSISGFMPKTEPAENFNCDDVRF